MVGESRGAGNFPDLAGIPVADAAAVAAVLATPFGFEDKLRGRKKFFDIEPMSSVVPNR